MISNNANTARIYINRLESHTAGRLVCDNLEQQLFYPALRKEVTLDVHDCIMDDLKQVIFGREEV